MKQNYCARRVPDKSYVKPGFGFLPVSASKLWTVVGSSVAVTMYDRKLGIGGMSHYYKSYLVEGQPASTMFAAPSICWLYQQMKKRGSQAENIEVQLFGGAVNPKHANFHSNTHTDNVKAGMEYLHKLRLNIATVDVGGLRGRKVIFNPMSGESVVARVDNIRESDWYPELIA